jgi:surface antigen
MKAKLFLLGCFGLVISGCATMSAKTTSPDIVQQALSSADQKALNLRLDTGKENEPQIWQNDEGNIHYQLTIAHTYINDQGMPCRNYTLLVDRDYHRKQVTTAVACRDNGKWKNQGATISESGSE